ncbi:MAG TPA: ribonuclease E activity regulator RraA [Gemmatimonadales bacterium]|nr:ribonuclease E activity regulator RraA [Gemmatimonadales bacterium]
MEFTTADLCDAFPQLIQVAEPLFREYGGVGRFGGPIDTLKVFEDNTLVRQALESSGRGRVLVVDGGGSLRCALVGERLAALARSNGWAGLLINGCVRDSAALRDLPVGIRALNTAPMRSEKNGRGDRGGRLRFAGVEFSPEHYLYADGDGILLAGRNLLG